MGRKRWLGITTVNLRLCPLPVRLADTSPPAPLRPRLPAPFAPSPFAPSPFAPASCARLRPARSRWLRPSLASVFAGFGRFPARPAGGSAPYSCGSPFASLRSARPPARPARCARSRLRGRFRMLKIVKVCLRKTGEFSPPAGAAATRLR